MKILVKIKNFIKNLFVDYNKINWMIEDNTSRIGEAVIENNSRQLEQLEHNTESKLNNISSKIDVCSEKIDKIVQENSNNYTELNTIFNHIKYCNTEVQGIINNPNKKNILLVGFYGAPNLGDELMLETILEYLKAVKNKRITIMLADNPNYNIDKYDDVSFIHYPVSLLDYNVLAEKFDYIIFGGGAIVDDSKYDETKSYQHDLGTIFIKLAIRAIAFKKKVISIGLSSNKSLKSEEYINKLEHIIRNSEYFSVRDEFSKNYLTSRIGNGIEEKIFLVNDIVFANPKIKNRIIDVRKKHDDIVNVGIVYIANNNNKEKLKTIIKSVKEQYKNVIINLISFYDYCNCDIRFYEAVINDIGAANINIIKYTDTMDDIIEIYEKNDIIIGLRYHAVLLAYLLNIPCIPVCYDIHEHYIYKMRYLNQLFNKKNELFYTTLCGDEIKKSLENITNDSHNEFELCNQIAEEAQNEFKKIIKLHM